MSFVEQRSDHWERARARANICSGDDCIKGKVKGLLSNRPEVEKRWNVPDDTNCHTDEEKSSDYYVRVLVETAICHAFRLRQVILVTKYPDN